MKELKNALEAFGHGNINFEKLGLAFDGYLAANPGRAATVRKLLVLARNKGLPEHIFKSLNAKVEGILHPQDPDATVLTAGDRTAAQAVNADATVLAGADMTTPPASPAADATVVVSDDDNRTAAHGYDSDATMVVEDQQDGAADMTVADGFDILDPSNLDAAEKAAETSQTGASWPTKGGMTTQSSGPVAGVDKDFGPNDVLRGRFMLLSKLGEGGMGAVWRAKDLLKEEARDRNPFVAIKMLQGDFKSHPESFIALQRETAKQQRLAHPNIATVYDFDRDMETGTVYMTMEVMVGAPMDSYIRKLPKDGLPYEEAMDLIEQLGAGLNYAHDAKLVHSDLKPGNCFYTKDGTVKLLDFGIARASKTKGDAEGETTLFDPGELGALTPTYATIEMFNGEDPDPRDDIYAMAIIAYQLLSSRHPFNKKPAPKAKELGLTAEPLDKLTKHQNKEMARGLAFLREDRTPSVEDFLKGLRPRESKMGRNIAIAAVLIVAIVAGSVGPIANVIKEQEREDVIAQIELGAVPEIATALELARNLEDEDQRNKILDDPRTRDVLVKLLAQGNEKSINDGLRLIAPMAKVRREQILDDDRAKTAIFDFFAAQRTAAVDPAEGQYDYPTAEKSVKKLEKIYTDSARVLTIRNNLKNEKQAELSQLSDAYAKLLDEGMLLPSKDEQDIGDILTVVAQIDPENGLLSDRQLPIRFADIAQEAINAKDFNRAQEFLKASVAYAADDTTLNGLRYEVEAELKRQQDAILVASIQNRLETKKSSLKTLQDFQNVRDDMIKLAELSPSNPVLTALQSSLKKAFGKQLGADIKGGKFAQAEDLLVAFAKFMELPYVLEQRGLLTAAEEKAGFKFELDEQRQVALAERKQALDELLAKPVLGGDWESRVKQNYKELLALAPSEDESIKAIRDRIAGVYLDNAAKSRESGRFAEALALIEKGQAFDATAPAFAAESQAIAAAQEALRKQQEEERRLARLETLKRELKTKANATQPKEAAEILAKLRDGLAPEDVFLTTEAPDLIAQAYLRQAAQMEEREDWGNALAFANSAKELAPTLPGLAEKLSLYEAAYAKDKQIIDFRAALSAWPIKVSTASLKKQHAAIRNDLPDRFKAENSKWADILAQRVRAQGTANSAKVAALAKPLEVMKALFPNTYKRASVRLAGGVKKRLGALRSKKDYKGHERLLAAAKKALPKEQTIASIQAFERPKASKLAARAQEEVKAGKLTAARATLGEVRKNTPNALNLPQAQAALKKRMQQANSDWNNYQRYVKAKREKQGRPYCTRATQFWADNPSWRCGPGRTETGQTGGKLPRYACTTRKAGLGKSARATCHDIVGGKDKGPTLVVVPAGGGQSKPFAIGKYEVTINDYNIYCRRSKKCSPKRGNKDLPVTGITYAAAKGYAQWLSTTTKATYRIPSAGEWEFAAKAGGRQPKKDFNCRVNMGSQCLKGCSLVSSRSGKQNGWGLANYVGNAQEWVNSGGGIKVRGGGYEDPLAKCGISLSKTHGGNADTATGFRILREMG